MDLTPQAIRATTFRRVKRGYDPEEVEAFRTRVADHVEQVQGQAETMESRARAAVAKLQELVDQRGRTAADAQPADDDADGAPDGDASGEQPEVISRTLLVAQRTAESMVAEARDEAARLLESARSIAARTIDDARHEARRASEDERVRAENEVHALLARRDFLLGDVEQLEDFLDSQRERLRSVADHLRQVAGDVPSGLGRARRPLLSASDDTDSFWDDDETGAPMSGMTLPARVAPSHTMPGGTTSDDTVSGDTVSDDTVSDDTVSGDTVSDDRVSDDTASDDAVSGGSVAADLVGVDAALVEAALRIAIDAVHAETEALGVDSAAVDAGQRFGGADATATMTSHVDEPHVESAAIDGTSPDPTPPSVDPSSAADALGPEIVNSAGTSSDDTVPLDDAALVDEAGARSVFSDADEVGSSGLDDETVDADDDDVAIVADDVGDDVDDTWDALRLPMRPLPVDADWDDDLPVSAAASAAERAARMHRVETPAVAPAVPVEQQTSPAAPRQLDALAERARRRGDLAGDEESFRISGDELH